MTVCLITFLSIHGKGSKRGHEEKQAYQRMVALLIYVLRFESVDDLGRYVESIYAIITHETINADHILSLRILSAFALRLLKTSISSV